MKRSSAATLIVCGVVGLAAGFLLEVALAGSGRPIFVPPFTVGVALGVVGILLIGFALPVRRALRGTATTMINPFRAARIALLAQASSVVAALALGFGAGIVLFILTRRVVADSDYLWLAGATAAGALVLLVLALLAEQFCALPPSDRDDDEPEPKPTPHD